MSRLYNGFLIKANGGGSNEEVMGGSKTTGQGWHSNLERKSHIPEKRGIRVTVP